MFSNIGLDYGCYLSILFVSGTIAAFLSHLLDFRRQPASVSRETPADRGPLVAGLSTPPVSERREVRGERQCNALIFSAGGEKSGSQRSPFIDVETISSDEEELQTRPKTKGWF